MDTVFVKVSFKLDCDWEGFAPSYRIYVNDEMFTERTFRWEDASTIELLQISAPVGRYNISVEPTGQHNGRFEQSEFCVLHGPAKWLDHNILEITNES